MVTGPADPGRSAVAKKLPALVAEEQFQLALKPRDADE